VKLRILVDTDGHALQSVVESSSGYDRLDQATAQALGRCRFIPGTRNGVPVQDWVRLLHVWRLEN
jgi:protein TonB